MTSYVMALARTRDSTRLLQSGIRNRQDTSFTFSRTRLGQDVRACLSKTCLFEPASGAMALGQHCSRVWLLLQTKRTATPCGGKCSIGTLRPSSSTTRSGQECNRSCRQYYSWGVPSRTWRPEKRRDRLADDMLSVGFFIPPQNATFRCRVVQRFTVHKLRSPIAIP